MNLYGFANGDPVNFSDPFGLCDDPRRPECRNILARAFDAFHAWVADRITQAVDLAGDAGNWLKRNAPRVVAEEAVTQAVVPVVGSLRHGRRIASVASDIGRFLTENRHLRNAVEARHDWAGVGLNADDVVAQIARGSGWETASMSLMNRTMRIGTVDVGYSIFRNPANPGEWIVNAWIR